jgi:hypothetical protein
MWPHILYWIRYSYFLVLAFFCHVQLVNIFNIPKLSYLCEFGFNRFWSEILYYKVIEYCFKDALHTIALFHYERMCFNYLKSIREKHEKGIWIIMPGVIPNAVFNWSLKRINLIIMCIRSTLKKKKLECKYLTTDYGNDLLKEMEICLALFSRFHPC